MNPRTLDAPPVPASTRSHPTLPFTHCFQDGAKLNRRIALFPIIFFELYLTFTVFLFAFGPWPWPVPNPIALYGFLAAAQVALLVGYLSAIRKQRWPSLVKWRPPWIVFVSLLVGFLWLIQLYKIRTNTLDFTFGSALQAVATGLSSPEKNYFLKNQNAGIIPSDFVGYLTFFAYPFLWAILPLGVVYWNRLPSLTRIALILWIIGDIMTWIASGMNKGIADYALLLPWLLLARRPSVLATVNRRKVLELALVALIGMGALLTFFSMNMLGRGGGQVVLQDDPAAGISLETDNLLIRFLPSAVQGSAGALTTYITQGYYALSLALQEPFVFCYGVGNSYFLEGLTRKFVIHPISDLTYPARIETHGWSRLGRWHTFYVWVASDVSFYGTIIVMLLIGRLLASVWLDVVFFKDPIAICLFALLVIMLMYAPGNNQVLGFPGTATPFWTLLFTRWLARPRARQTAHR